MSALNRELYNIFSNPRYQTIEDIVAVGGVLDVDILEHAYQYGVFPWPHESYPLLWFAPEKRGVIDFKDLHLPKSFQKWLKKNESQYEIKFNTCFSEVLKNCRSQIRKGQKGTWINDEIEKAYNLLFKKDKAFSIEIFRSDKLVGGLYGVKSEKYYSCESMFHLEDNTSKLALYKLCLSLQDGGHQWMDIQMVTDVCKSFGGKLIAKEKFLQRIGF